MDALIAHMIFDPATNTYRPGNNSSREEVEATLIPFSPCPDPRQARDIPSSRPTKLRIYPDSGATICLGGPKHLRHMGISEKNLVPSSKKVRTVGGFSLTFITEWGRFMHLRMPQGYVAAGDAYTRRYDEIIKDIPRKIKVVDDTLLYDKTIKDAFYYTLDYLSLCETNGIVINKDKFQFCQDVVQFGGLQITPTGVTHSHNLLNAISSFASPKNHYRCKVLVRACQPSSMGILIKPYNATIPRTCKKKIQLRLKSKSRKSISAI